MPVRRRHGFHPRAQDPAYLEAVTVWVYAICDGTAVKVGKSAGHPSLRLAELQTGNPRELRLVAYTAHLTERQAHRLLHRYHRRGEWFGVGVVRELLGWDYVDEAAVRRLAPQAPAAGAGRG